jgi:hypothetical protein
MEPDKSKKEGFHHPHFWLCMLLTLGEFSLLYSILFISIPESNQRIADMMFGSYTTAWLTSVGYWYQTTFGSNTKTALLAKAEPVKE